MYYPSFNFWRWWEAPDPMIFMIAIKYQMLVMGGACLASASSWVQTTVPPNKQTNKHKGGKKTERV
jgi:hypothetical protein